MIDSFYAFATTYLGGLTVAAGDLNADGYADVVVGAIGGHIATFDGAALANGNPVSLAAQFAAFESNFGGSISLAAGDLNGDGAADIVVSAADGTAPRIAVFDGRSLAKNRTVMFASFFAGDLNNHSGVRVATADVDGDGRIDLIVSPGSGSDGTIRIYSGANGFAGTPTPSRTITNSAWSSNGTFVG